MVIGHQNKAYSEYETQRKARYGDCNIITPEAISSHFS